MTGLFDGSRGLVKVCGLRRPVDAVTAARAGADLLGFVFAPSKRRVTPDEAAACVAAARSAADRPILAVGVVVDAPLAEIVAAVEIAGLALVQLHGDEPDELLAALPCPAIKAVRPTPGTVAQTFLGTLRFNRGAADRPVAWLVDGFDPASYGGTGARADRGLVAEIVGVWPTFLAVVLTPDNSGEAVGL